MAQSFHSFDESCVDPRLRAGDAENRGVGNEVLPPAPDWRTGLAPSPHELPYEMDRDFYIRDWEANQVLPSSAYTSLDWVLAQPNGVRDENERCWLKGVQEGIGLGIHGAREVMLNEMMMDKTVFRQPLVPHHADCSSYGIRMAIGEKCRTGFDIRVANRVAQNFYHRRPAAAGDVPRSAIIGTTNPMYGDAALFGDGGSTGGYEITDRDKAPIDYDCYDLLNLPSSDDDDNTNNDNNNGVAEPALVGAPGPGHMDSAGGNAGKVVMQPTGTTAAVPAVPNMGDRNNQASSGDSAMPGQKLTIPTEEPGLAMSPFAGNAQLVGYLGDYRNVAQAGYDGANNDGNKPTEPRADPGVKRVLKPNEAQQSWQPGQVYPGYQLGIRRNNHLYEFQPIDQVHEAQQLEQFQQAQQAQETQLLQGTQQVAQQAQQVDQDHQAQQLEQSQQPQEAQATQQAEEGQPAKRPRKKPRPKGRLRRIGRLPKRCRRKEVAGYVSSESDNEPIEIPRPILVKSEDGRAQILSVAEQYQMRYRNRVRRASGAKI
ncbi:hypothetical protein F4808DRAFT_468230 [Astrocystis sublimbata]|nr:hypothetical protein F4808DRAFT_468230 [Astrocystis sublimbata]